MAEIIPAILPRNYEDLKNKIALVRGVAPMVQIDICDGNYTKTLTWPFLVKTENTEDEDFLSNSFDNHFVNILNEEEGLPFWEDVDFELDLMVLNAVENFDIYTKLGPKSIVFHLEAVGNIEEFAHFLEGIDNYVRDTMKIGVSINNNTLVENIYPVVPYVDFVQVMGIDHEGIQGEDFDEKCLEHVKNLKNKFPDLLISIDGGIDFDTAPKAIQAGANKLVIGSAIFNTDDILNVIEEFRLL
jgi:ribulose-phosphate 3-epimerase